MQVDASQLEAHRAPLDGPLLPHAGVGFRRRGRCTGNDGPRVAKSRPVRGTVVPANLVVPDCHQRLPRRAHRPVAAGASDGRRAARVGRRPSRDPRPCSLARTDSGRPRPSGGCRPVRTGRPQTEYSPGVRLGASAPAAAAAGGAAAERSPGMVGSRSRRLPGHVGRCREQRAAAGSCDGRDAPR